jgi:TonB-linked SusC/RagA family outer membrane protein
MRRSVRSAGARSWVSGVGLGLVAALLIVAPATAQQGTIAGTVVDARSLQPLASAQVSVEGTGQGTITDSRGRFQLLNVTGPTATLRVQMLGFRAATEQVPVGSLDVRISLAQTAIELDEVVVTGTAGAQQRRAIGNAVTTIDASRLNEIAPVPDVGMMLNARSPGVVVMPGTGMVGAGSRIRIRGASSFSLNDQPLIYIDGVRVNNDVSSGPTIQGFGGAPISRLGDINPADIESIEVIKGPAAATLYGTEAANGVIQIITKRGRVSERPQISAYTRQGVTWFGNAEGRINPAVYRDANGVIQEMNLVRLERERGTPIWTPGHLQGYGVDVSGGSEFFRYHASSNYDADNGIEPTNDLRRLTGRLNLSFAPFEALDVSTNLGLISSRTNLARENGGTWFDTRLGSPNFLNTPQRGFWRRPPEITWAAHRDFQELARFIAGVQANNRVTPWFTQRLTLGLDLTGENNQSITERMDDTLAPFYSAQAALGDKSAERRDVSYTTFDYGGTVSLPVSGELNSNSSFGFQYYRRFVQTVSATGREFPAGNLSTIEATAVTFGSDNYVENTTVGVYGQQQFEWRNRLFVTAAIRADDNSAFGENFSLVYYPKLSASWVVNEEPFWNVPLVDALRLRFAYGASGQQPETFAALRTYAPITTGSGGAALTPQFIGNPDLAPERGEEIEVGFETAFFNQRLGLEFTYFNQRTRDAILLREQPPSLGFPGSQFVNVGEIRNRGLEMQLRAMAVERPGTNLELLFNLSTNDNRVIDLGGEEFIALGAQQHRVGYPVAAWFEQRIVSAEVNAQGRAINVLCDDGQGGAMSCRDAPRIYLGRSQPNVEGSFTPTLTLFDRLTLHAMLDFKLGYKKDDTERQARCSTRQICMENLDPARYPIIAAEVQDPTVFNTNLRLHDASFGKFRELAASYTLPSDWAARAGASRASVRLSARNLMTWTRWQGLDPESYRMNQLHSRSEQEAMPQLQQVMATVNFVF